MAITTREGATAQTRQRSRIKSTRISTEVTTKDTCQKSLAKIERATVAVLLCLTEVDKSSGAAHRVFRTMEDCDAEIDSYSIEFNRQRREEHRPLGPPDDNMAVPTPVFSVVILEFCYIG
ncbi:hypothetical protein LIPSTDRAFT_105549 [Lipomyces starkeyi NRRL Y-11557]|uniref:Uncharacterized protein n=1 Tax=Lipomyces starkeyi NRRL Y-11557 TaxID=675824 RepID=A0A1E3Q2R2_LIPST|nr:hypothetical protein LIPSTDRAFT_105549 [Lipomyces starkeyi NRRL Y-11557]